jgi:8-oxo-dGTP pyrophosphatase MutT (NUDIX family)
VSMTKPKLGRRVAGALLVAETGRYLMQRRDDFPSIPFPGAWSCFGGGIEPGEAPEAALRRELAEELSYAARTIERFTELRVLLPFATPRIDVVGYFAVPIREAEIAGMVQREGAGLALFTAAALAREPRVLPWDLAAVLMHARREALFASPR